MDSLRSIIVMPTCDSLTETRTSAHMRSRTIQRLHNMQEYTIYNCEELGLDHSYYNLVRTNLAVWMSALKNSANWKAPGKDGPCIFWWKGFHRISGLLWKTDEEVLKLKKADLKLPAWFVEEGTICPGV